MNPVVKLTKQGVRDLDSGRKRIRTAPAEDARDEGAPSGPAAEGVSPAPDAPIPPTDTEPVHLPGGAATSAQ